ncbi:hypothetical protein AB4090_14235 [Acidithiobacillus sp. IBUN Pt1247-S3]|uniref:hypothetical protein n=1 Tax=Acidithiobacillus sp. IBUN Pt1247-S3 TaxID=3166642 RepID=UPI0034E4D50F
MRLKIPYFALVVIMTNAPCAVASPPTKPFVAPGLWEIVTDVTGPMQQHSRRTQQECWNAEGQSGQSVGMLPGAGAGPVTSSHVVDNSDQRSTVRVHTAMQLPQGQMTQNITMVFTRGPGDLRHATMTGSGSMTWSNAPMLNETFTQHGHWIAAVCSATLPPAGKTAPQIQAMRPGAQSLLQPGEWETTAQVSTPAGPQMLQQKVCNPGSGVAAILMQQQGLHCAPWKETSSSIGGAHRLETICTQAGPTRETHLTLDAHANVAVAPDGRSAHGTVQATGQVDGRSFTTPPTAFHSRYLGPCAG